MRGKIRRPCLSRAARTGRNLLLAAALAFFLWGSMDFPLPTLELRFRRTEQANWVGPSRIVSGFQADGGRWVAASCEDQLLLWRDGRGWFYYWPRGEGPSVLPVYSSRPIPKEIWILAVEEPEGAVSARLTARAESWIAITGSWGSGTHWNYAPDLDSGDWNAGEEPKYYELEFTAAAERPEEKGGFLFPLVLETPESEDALPGTGVTRTDVEQRLLEMMGGWESYRRPAQRVGGVCSLHVEFFDGNGALVGQADLSTPD